MPNISEIIATFGAFHLKRWHRVDFLLLFTYDGNSLLNVVFDDFAISWLDFPAQSWLLVSTLGAYKHDRNSLICLNFFRFKNGTAFRAKLHNQTPFLFSSKRCLMEHPN